MIDLLQSIDTNVFLFFNGFHTAFLDPYMRLLTGKLAWIPFYLAIAAVIFKIYGWKRGLWMVAAIGAAVGCADVVCSQVIRPVVERLRPSNLANPIVTLVHVVNDYRSTTYGFPSCHAANTFALAVGSALAVRRRPYTITIFAWALIECYTRLYLGVHYPGDLLVGGCVGALSGWAFYCAARKLAKIDPRPASTLLASVPAIVCAATMIVLLFVRIVQN